MANSASPYSNEERNAALAPFDNAEAFASLWTKAFALAAKEAMDENARMNIPSPGVVDGRLALKNPDGKIVFVPRFDL